MFWDGTRWIDGGEPAATPSRTRDRARVRLAIGIVVVGLVALPVTLAVTSAVVSPAEQASRPNSGLVMPTDPASRGPQSFEQFAKLSAPPEPSIEVRLATAAPAASASATASVVRATPAPNPAPIQAAVVSRAHVVQRRGTSLTLDGQPFLFTGINIYMAASGGTPSSCGGELYPNVGVPLSQMPDGVVIRFWAFQNFFVSHKSFDWSNLDEVLKIAAAHHDKVIPVLANQYSYCDGATKDLAWYLKGYRTTIGPGDVVTYREFVSEVIRRYAGNPTIAMWQLVNEGQAPNKDGSCSESSALAALLAFSNDVGGMAHGLDPAHLVSLGTLAGYSGSGRQWCGAFNTDYQTLMASPGSDVCDFHDYGYPTEPMGMPFGPNLASAVGMCHAVGKPIMVAETGIYAESPTTLAPRSTQFRAKFSAQFQAGVVGELMWEWKNKPDYVVPPKDPDYGIYPGDPSLGVLGHL